MKKFRFIQVVMALGVLTFIGGTERPTFAAQESKPSDAKIMLEIHDINQEEIEMGQLAKSRGTTKEIRDFGEKLVQDHKQADKVITDLAKREKVDLKAEGKMKTAEERQDAANEKSMIERLKKAKGTQFDTEFTQEMVSGHKSAIRKLTAAKEQLPADSELRGAIEKILPLLVQHERIAADLEKTKAAA